MLIAGAESTAFDAILDRPEAETHVTTYFADECRVLGAMVDYGTHLIPRCWSGSAKSLRDIVALTVLTKQAVGLLDAAHVLLCSGAVQPARLQLRGLFEVSIYIDWILTQSSERRARAYYVANLRRRLHWVMRAKVDTAEWKEFSDDFKTLALPDAFKDAQHLVEAELTLLNAALAKPQYRPMNSEFNHVRGLSKHDPQWFVVAADRKHVRKPTLYTLAKQLDRRAEYRLIYE